MKRIIIISFVFFTVLLSSCTASAIRQNSVSTAPKHPNLEITEVTTYTDETGYFNIQGEVLNAGGYDMKDVKVIATFYDGSKKLVGTAGIQRTTLFP
jgi:hypothetical protein